MVYSIFIYSLVLVLSLFTIKVVFDTSFEAKAARDNYQFLSQQIDFELMKKEKNQQRLKLIDDLNKTLKKGAFRILKEMISIQEFVFKKHFN